MTDKFLKELDHRKEIGSRFTNRFIIAGAGAGKTKTIVDSILSSLTTDIKEDKVLPSEIVAITFTNKAAAELRTRIFAKLNEVVDKEKNPDKLKELIYIRDNLSTMQISTIHSFCLRLLQEQAFLAGLPLDADIVMDDECKKRYLDYLVEWIERNTNKYNEYKARLGSLRDRCFEMVLNMFIKSNNYPDELIFATEGDEDALSSRDESYYALQFKELFDSFFDAYVFVVNDYFHTTCKTFEDACDLTDSNDANKQLVRGTFPKSYETISEHSNLNYCIKLFKEFFGKDKKDGTIKIQAGLHGSGDNIQIGSFVLNTAKKKDFDNNVFAKWGKYDEFIKLIEEFNIYINYVVLSIVKEIRKDYIPESKGKKYASKITQNKILEEACALVNKNPKAKEYFRKRFKHIYVDEFQDTDKIQKDLVFGLFTDEKTGKLFDNCLFVVGDPKQSIYSFRGGDIKVYNEAKETFIKQGIKPDIFEINFRSNKAVIDEVNKTFSKRFAEEEFNPACKKNPSNAVTYDNMTNNLNVVRIEGLNPNDNILKGLYCVSPQFIETSPKYSPDDFEDLAYVIEYIKSNYKIERLVKDENEQYRKIDSIKDSDFLVLTSTKTNIFNYVKALKKHGIPVTMSGKLDFNKEKAYTRLKALINFIATPDNKVAQYGVVEVLTDKYCINSFEDQRKAADMVNALYEATKDMNSIEVLEYLCEHMEYILDLYQEDYEVLNYQSRLHQLLEFVMENNLTSKIGLAELLDEYINTLEQERELVIDDAENPVRFMNFHKSKGLEGKIVIIADRRNNSVDDDKIESFKYNEGGEDVLYPLAYFGDMNKTKYRAFKSDSEIFEKETDRLIEEKLRLEYVALTRAEEAVVFMRARDKATSFNNYEDLNDVVRPLGFVPPVIKQEEHKTVMEIEDYRTDEKKFDSHTVRNNPVVNPSLVEGKSDNEITETSYIETPINNIFGNMMHRVFELNIQSKWNKVPSDNKSIINKAIFEQFDDLRELNKEVLVKDLNKLLDDFNKDPFIKECLENSSNVYTELPFTVNAVKSEVMGPNLIKQLNEKFKGIESFSFNGRIDLLFELKDGKYVIVDYKSDKLRKNMDEHLTKKYAPQQELYMFALSKIKGVKPENISYKLYAINK